MDYNSSPAYVNSHESAVNYLDTFITTKESIDWLLSFNNMFLGKETLITYANLDSETLLYLLSMYDGVIDCLLTSKNILKLPEEYIKANNIAELQIKHIFYWFDVEDCSISDLEESYYLLPATRDYLKLITM